MLIDEQKVIFMDFAGPTHGMKCLNRSALANVQA
jgi:hypothetical protein